MPPPELEPLLPPLMQVVLPPLLLLLVSLPLLLFPQLMMTSEGVVLSAVAGEVVVDCGEDAAVVFVPAAKQQQSVNCNTLWEMRAGLNSLGLTRHACINYLLYCPWRWCISGITIAHSCARRVFQDRVPAVVIGALCDGGRERCISTETATLLHHRAIGETIRSIGISVKASLGTLCII